MAESRRTYRYWTAEELDKLEELAGQYPFSELCRRFNYWAGQQGMPKRSPQSIRKQANAQKLTTFAWGDWIRVGTVAELLGKHRSTVHQWVAAGWLTRLSNGPASSVRRHQLRQLARERPQLFGGVDRGALVQLLEIEELADWILEQAPRRWQSRRNGVQVRWVERGLVFRNYVEAGKAAHLCPKSVRRSVVEGRPVCGMRFERVA